MLNHRGVTHSLILLPAWAWLVAWVMAKLLRDPGGWRALYGICAMSIGAHIAGDWITSFGTMIFAPFSNWRAALGTTYIIDLWFSGIIALGLVFSAVFFRSRIPSFISLAILVGYIGFQYVQKEKALEFAVSHAVASGLKGADIGVYPGPVSPFNWTLFASGDRTQHLAYANLVRETPRRFVPGEGFVAKLDAPYEPLDSVHWQTRSRYGEGDVAKAAWDSPALRFFRWFAARPALEAATRNPECYWFVDLRFVSPGRDWVPFRFGACREPSGAGWRASERDDLGKPVAID